MRSLVVGRLLIVAGCTDKFGATHRINVDINQPKSVTVVTTTTSRPITIQRIRFFERVLGTFFGPHGPTSGIMLGGRLPFRFRLLLSPSTVFTLLGYGR